MARIISSGRSRRLMPSFAIEEGGISPRTVAVEISVDLEKSFDRRSIV